MCSPDTGDEPQKMQVFRPRLNGTLEVFFFMPDANDKLTVKEIEVRTEKALLNALSTPPRYHCNSKKKPKESQSK